MTLTKGVVNADSPCHTLLTLDGWENFGGVLESYWAFTQRVRDGEEVNKTSIVVSIVILSMRFGNCLQNDRPKLCTCTCRLGLEKR